MLSHDSKFRRWESIEALVWKIASKVYRRASDAGLMPRFDVEDLVQEGAACWVKAVELFDEEAGVQFTTYLVNGLYRGMNRFVQQNGYIRHNVTASHVSLDHSMFDDGETMVDLMVDEQQHCPSDWLVAEEIFASHRRKMSRLAGILYEWEVAPPTWLLEEYKAREVFIRLHSHLPNRSQTDSRRLNDGEVVARIAGEVLGYSRSAILKARSEINAARRRTVNDCRA